MSMPLSVAATDSELWSRVTVGDRDAFAKLVDRHQNLLCSLAYSGCGDFALAEEIAQEAFIHAWRRPEQLREPSRLRAWLCGMVRNLARGAFRGKQVVRAVLPLDTQLQELPCTDNGPVDQAIYREEASLLWKTLASIPEPYRDAMVLYYREGHSTSQVAAHLDITEDAARQRLTRGRAMLRSELAGVLESVLTNTRPSKTFTAAVLAALPAFVMPQTASAAGLGSVLVGKAGSGGLGLLFAKIMPFLGPVAGLFIGLASAQVAAANARSQEEAVYVRRSARTIVLYAWTMSLVLVGAILTATTWKLINAPLLLSGLLAWIVLLVGGIYWRCLQIDREVVRIRAANGTSIQSEHEKSNTFWSDGAIHYEIGHNPSGIPILSVHIQGMGSVKKTAVGWIAVGDTAISPLFALGGLAVAPLAMGGITLGLASVSCWGIALGGLAFGSFAVGWVAVGAAAVGYRAAIGFVAAARDVALGPYVMGQATGAAAVEAMFVGHPLTPLAIGLMVFATFLSVVITLTAIAWCLIRALRSKRALRCQHS